MRSILTEWWLRAALLAVGAVLLASGSLPVAGQELAKTYVGRIAGAEGVDGLVAVVVGPDGKAIAYACSADNAWNEANSRWYTGEMTTQGTVSASARDGKQLTGQTYGDSLTGTIDGQSFTATLVTSGTAGLYRGRDGDETHAVIEAPDGTRVGGVWHGSTGRWGWTWSFPSTIQVQRTGTLLRLQRPPTAPPPPAAAAVPPTSPSPPDTGQQFIFVELQNCSSSFDSCG